MKRTAEKVLAIISAVFTGISIILGFIFLSTFKTFNTSPELRREFEAEILSSQEISSEQASMIMSMVDALEGFSLFIIAILIISLIATIVGIVFIWNNKNPKIAGAMFIIGGLFAFLLSPTSILLYIAGILCFTKKLPMQHDRSPVEDNYGGTMRPL